MMDGMQYSSPEGEGRLGEVCSEEGKRETHSIDVLGLAGSSDS